MSVSIEGSVADSIRFILNGEIVTVADVEPTHTVLNYLRENQGKTGTKEGCAEGDCGACTVVIAELHDAEIELKTVNACIQFVPTLDGKAVFTVEYLRQADQSLHPVQQAMVDEHASQCGFCTPGFVMSLWALYNQHQRANSLPDQGEIRSALTGNLCRCTGYRPILDAAESMFKLPPVALQFEQLRSQLQSIQRQYSLEYLHADSQYFAPKTIVELMRLRADHPEATILAGGTDIGIWVNKQFRALNPILFIGEVRELKHVYQTDRELHIGAGVTLTTAHQEITQYYPETSQLWERFASVPIRNVGTLGGNIANGSPIGDSMPALIALGAEVSLRNNTATRRIPLEKLYLGYMQKAMAADEIVEAIHLPLPRPEQTFRCYKLSKRHDSDISAVFAAFSITREGEQVTDCRFAYGGMAATPSRPKQCEAAVRGELWSEQAVQAAMQALSLDFSPMSDMRATAQNRMQSAQNLLYRFYLETRDENSLLREQLDVFGLDQVL